MYGDLEPVSKEKICLTGKEGSQITLFHKTYSSFMRINTGFYRKVPLRDPSPGLCLLTRHY